MRHSELKEKALRKEGVGKAYDVLEPEFSLLREMLKARRETGINQAEIARRMGTKAPSVARLESFLSYGKHSPFLATLKKYARALGYRLEIKFVADR